MAEQKSAVERARERFEALPANERAQHAERGQKRAWFVAEVLREYPGANRARLEATFDAMEKATERSRQRGVGAR